MNKITIFIFGVAMLFSMACRPEESNHRQSEVPSAKSKVQSNSNRQVLKNLDSILSPFEDMTESALTNNEAGVRRALARVKNASQNSLFSKNLSAKGLRLLKPKLKQLSALIEQKKFNQAALISTNIFGNNINYFNDASKVKNQIHIEHLDYMGYEVWALLHQDSIDWKKMEQSISGGQNYWKLLSPKVKDGNLRASFSYIFKGLDLSAQNKQIQMSEILAHLDLSLVDVLEKNI